MSETKLLSAQISPNSHMDVLSRLEVTRLLDSSQGGLYKLFRACSLAVLNSGSQLDDGKALLEAFPSFEIRVIQRERGIKLEVVDAPAEAFVDGEMIHGIAEHLFAVLRDIIYTHDEVLSRRQFDLGSSEGITNAVFHILRNAGILRSGTEPNLVVCWGGHSIKREEYDYTKEVGHQLGLRALDICTGCGPGAMKGPMKGATIAHAKQRFGNGKYLGITEPGIIAAESPNPIVNELVIVPDIEKRLEAFVRVGHAIVVFPGGVGTAEEILYLLGVLLHPKNKNIPFPLIFTGPKSSESYFHHINKFIGDTLGFEAQQRYKIIIDDPERVAREVHSGIAHVRTYRRDHDDAFYFNWLLHIDADYQNPFEPTHENMRNLQLHRDQPPHQLASNLRKAFSGIVAGNVKEEGILAIERHGLFELKGDDDIMEKLDTLLAEFVQQQRMKLPGSHYVPCYKIVR